MRVSAAAVVMGPLSASELAKCSSHSSGRFSIEVAPFSVTKGKRALSKSSL